jgi:hypothetical protein
MPCLARDPRQAPELLLGSSSNLCTTASSNVSTAFAVLATSWLSDAEDDQDFLASSKCKANHSPNGGPTTNKGRPESHPGPRQPVMLQKETPRRWGLSARGSPLLGGQATGGAP